MSIERTAKPGYIPAPSAYTGKRREYPFEKIKEGEYLDPPYAFTDLAKVRQAVIYWNRKKDGVLSVSRFPEGSPDHPEPHLKVGWAVGAVKRQRLERKNGATKSAKVPTPAK